MNVGLTILGLPLLVLPIYLHYYLRHPSAASGVATAGSERVPVVCDVSAVELTLTQPLAKE